MSSTRMSVPSWMALHTRYIPMLARMVVISKVPSSWMTFSKEAMTSSGVMYTSVWSLPIYSAAWRAYFRSMASARMPMAKVRMGALLFRAAMAHTREESSPPESRKPTLASATSRFSTPATSLSWIFRQAVSRSSRQTCSTAAMSR